MPRTSYLPLCRLRGEYKEILGDKGDEMLTSRIAQRIADEVMSGLGYNVNVMNEKGIIIGSGSESRIGSFHETATRVLESGGTVVVTEKELQGLQGVLPGINMPIRSNGVLVGVVGITGHPNEIKGVAQLVRMAAELIVEQEETTCQFYMRRNDKNAFVISLLNDTTSGSTKNITNWAAELGFDMKIPRVACLLDLPEDKAAYIECQERQLNAVKDSEFHRNQDISVSMGTNTLVFKTLKGTSPWEIEQEVCEYVQGIRSGPDAELSKGLRCCVGAYHAGIQGYSLSYADACRLQTHYADTDAIVFAHRHLGVTLFDKVGAGCRKEILKPYISAIRKEFGDGAKEAIKTAKALLENGYHYEAAAKKLFVHKNTIAFRRKKLESCLGLDPRINAEDQLLLMMIILEFESSEQEESRAERTLCSGGTDHLKNASEISD